MEKVAAVIPSKYEMIGLQLGLTPAQLQAIRPQHQSLEDYHRAFGEIFSEWRRRGSPPYTWRTLTGVLRSASVGEVLLSEHLTFWITSNSDITADTVPVTLDSEPSLQHLMEKVAAVIPSKYEMVGLQLGLTPAQLQAIRPQHQSLEDYHRAFGEIFSEWRRRGSPPYTWRTLTGVLRSASVGEVLLSEHLTFWITSNSDITADTVPVTLDSEPSLQHLMEKVAAVIPHKYELIGLQLCLSLAELQVIGPRHPTLVKHHRAFGEMFGVWRRRGSPPYTWRTLIDVLRSPSVGEVLLSDQLTSWITRNSDITGGTAHVSLDSEPSLQHFLEKVAAVIPSKCWAIGLQLGLTIAELQAICPQHQDLEKHYRAFGEIFDVWRRRGSLPFTWRTLINVLRSPSVGEVLLSEELTFWITLNSDITGDAKGVNEIILCDDNHTEIIHMTKKACSEWRGIGMRLGFTDNELSAIVREPGRTHDEEYYSAMLMRWLDWAPPNHYYPSVQRLASALREVGYEGLAFDLDVQYHESANYSIPDPPSEVTAQPTSSKSIKVSWTLPQNISKCGAIQGSELSYSTSKSSTSVLNVGVTTFAEITGLQPYTTYNISVRTRAAGAYSQYSSPCTATTMEDSLEIEDISDVWKHVGNEEFKKTRSLKKSLMSAFSNFSDVQSMTIMPLKLDNGKYSPSKLIVEICIKDDAPKDMEKVIEHKCYEKNPNSAGCIKVVRVKKEFKLLCDTSVSSLGCFVIDRTINNHPSVSSSTTEKILPGHNFCASDMPNPEGRDCIDKVVHDQKCMEEDALREELLKKQSDSATVNMAITGTLIQEEQERNTKFQEQEKNTQDKEQSTQSNLDCFVIDRTMNTETILPGHMLSALNMSNPDGRDHKEKVVHDQKCTKDKALREELFKKKSDGGTVNMAITGSVLQEEQERNTKFQEQMQNTQEQQKNTQIQNQSTDYQYFISCWHGKVDREIFIDDGTEVVCTNFKSTVDIENGGNPDLWIGKVSTKRSCTNRIRNNDKQYVPANLDLHHTDDDDVYRSRVKDIGILCKRGHATEYTETTMISPEESCAEFKRGVVVKMKYKDSVFAKKGDSGSVVIEKETGYVIGMIVGSFFYENSPLEEVIVLPLMDEQFLANYELLKN